MPPTSTPADGTPGGPDPRAESRRRPTRSASTAPARVERARATLHRRYAQAGGERERLAAATDYVRSLAAAAAEAGGETAQTADQVLAGLVRELLRGGEALADLLSTRSRSRRAS